MHTLGCFKKYPIFKSIEGTNSAFCVWTIRYIRYINQYLCNLMLQAVLGKLLTSLLMITNYIKEIVVSNVIRWITHCLLGNLF